MNRKKGQANSLDFVISLIVFVVLLVFLITFWFVSISETENMIHREILGAQGISASDLMVKSPGVPSDWEYNESQVQVLGLASSQNVLSRGKVLNFTNMSYNSARSLLGIEGQYHFYIEDLEGNRLYESGNSTIGEKSASIMRLAILEGEKVRLWVIVHE